jgi:hypothetical protein
MHRHRACTHGRRELRDRYLEYVNAGGMTLEAAGKYDVTRALPASPGMTTAAASLPATPIRALPHAA